MNEYWQQIYSKTSSHSTLKTVFPYLIKILTPQCIVTQIAVNISSRHLLVQQNSQKSVAGLGDV